MPELPEVEILVRHLAPAIRNKSVRKTSVLRAKVLAPTSERRFRQILHGARFVGVERRGKYLVFGLRSRAGEQLVLMGHLGMTGRMYLQRAGSPLPKHAAVVLDLGRDRFVFEDTRYFGRLTLDATVLDRLGPEPLGDEFTPAAFAEQLRRSSQAIKVRLLDQRLLAGVGNIYASEALFRARLAPDHPARQLTQEQVQHLWGAIREVLTEAIAGGSTVPLNYSAANARDRLFYFGRATEGTNNYEERLHVYDRAGRPCVNCGSPIKRIVQAARSTFYCPKCQAARPAGENGARKPKVSRK